MLEPRVLIGAHVSTAGGLVNAHARGVEIGADAIQVFNQSPRMWRPTRWKDDDVAEFRELMDDGPIGVGGDPRRLPDQLRLQGQARSARSRSPRWCTRCGWATRIGAVGVVLHPGSTVGEPHDEALERVGRGAEPRAGRDRTRARCCWRTPPAPATPSAAPSRSWRELIDAGRRRTAGWACAWTPATCWPAASTCARPTGWPRSMDALRRDRGPGPAALPARERLADAARLQPRPPRAARQRRARRPRLRRRSCPSPASRACRRCSRARASRARRSARRT